MGKRNIHINGINIRDIDLEKLRERISYVSQEVFLYSGTVLLIISSTKVDICITDPPIFLGKG